jgi:hypothetical protein
LRQTPYQREGGGRRTIALCTTVTFTHSCLTARRFGLSLLNLRPHPRAACRAWRDELSAA